jgi:hypothetical protein
MLFGREMSMPFDANMIPKDNLQPKVKLHMDEVIKNLKLSKAIASENMQQAQNQSKVRHDKKAVDPMYSVGDLVWLFCPKVPVGLSPKFHKKWTGPYYITQVGPNFTYRLRDCENNKMMKSLVHANRLKRFFDPKDRPTEMENPRLQTPLGNTNTDMNDNVVVEDTQASQTQRNEEDSNHTEPPQPDHTLPQNSQIDWREVERLIKVSRGQGKKWYRVKWKDKSPSTWVPEEEINDNLKREFHIKHTYSGKRRKRPHRFFKVD